MASRVEFLLKGVDDGWRITPFAKFLDGLTAEEANWRPAPEFHSIAEIINHVAYWLEYRARQVRGEPLEPLLPIPAAGEAPPSMPGYPDCLENLHNQFEALHNAVAALQEEDVDRPPKEGSPRSIMELVSNIIAHNAYHAGQIVLLRRLWALRTSATKEA